VAQGGDIGQAAMTPMLKQFDTHGESALFLWPVESNLRTFASEYFQSNKEKP